MEHQRKKSILLAQIPFILVHRLKLLARFTNDMQIWAKEASTIFTAKNKRASRNGHHFLTSCRRFILHNFVIISDGSPSTEITFHFRQHAHTDHMLLYINEHDTIATVHWSDVIEIEKDICISVQLKYYLVVLCSSGSFIKSKCNVFHCISRRWLSFRYFPLLRRLSWPFLLKILEIRFYSRLLSALSLYIDVSQRERTANVGECS